jgi:tyrosine aminotransferase
VNNPSNPCGTSYSREHLLAILEVAKKHRLPVISDEVYADMVFSGQMFHSMQALSQVSELDFEFLLLPFEKDVPLLVCGGIAKRFMVPGWRVGWVVVCDRNDQFRKGKIVEGIQRLSQTILGCCSLIQAVVPFLLEKTPAR